MIRSPLSHCVVNCLLFMCRWDAQIAEESAIRLTYLVGVDTEGAENMVLLSSDILNPTGEVVSLSSSTVLRMLLNAAVVGVADVNVECNCLLFPCVDVVPGVGVITKPGCWDCGRLRGFFELCPERLEFIIYEEHYFHHLCGRKHLMMKYATISAIFEFSISF